MSMTQGVAGRCGQIHARSQRLYHTSNLNLRTVFSVNSCRPSVHVIEKRKRAMIPRAVASSSENGTQREFIQIFKNTHIPQNTCTALFSTKTMKRCGGNHFYAMPVMGIHVFCGWTMYVFSRRLWFKLLSICNYHQNVSPWYPLRCIEILSTITCQCTCFALHTN